MFKSGGIIFTLTSFLYFTNPTQAQNTKQTTCDAYVLACGSAQLEANKCLQAGQEATSGVFGSLAAKMTSSEMGKTAADKAASQTANLVCKDKIEAAEAACKPKQ